MNFEELIEYTIKLYLQQPLILFLFILGIIYLIIEFKNKFLNRKNQNLLDKKRKPNKSYSQSYNKRKYVRRN